MPLPLDKKMELHDTPASKLAEIKAISPMILQMVTKNILPMTSVKLLNFFWKMTYMLGLVDSFSDKRLAFLWKQTLPHYWLTCFSIPTIMSFQINSLKRAKENLLESSISHIVTLMTLSLSMIKDLGCSFLIITPKKL